MSAGKPKGGRPPTRPNPLDEGMAQKIAERLAGGESMREISADPNMPASNMIYQAMHSNEAFRSVIARGREAQQDAEIEKTIAIADAATPETVHVAKLRIWARQWRAGKLASKKYGEKVTQEHTGADGGAIQVATPLCPSEVAARIGEMLAENEALVGLPPPETEMTDAERLSRIIATGEPVTPGLYAGISVSRGPDKKFPYRGEN